MEFMYTVGTFKELQTGNALALLPCIEQTLKKGFSQTLNFCFTVKDKDKEYKSLKCS